VPEYFGLTTPVELARALIDGRVDRERLAELTPLVFAAADEDAVAGAIVDRLADEVVAMVRAIATNLNLTGDDLDLVLGGGLLQAGNVRLFSRIVDSVREVGPRFVVRAADHPPVVGAALMALDRVAAGPDAQARLRAAFA
jgi:N-acetylglucosamine kinase-like BadF-type ATPase